MINKNDYKKSELNINIIIMLVVSIITLIIIGDYIYSVLGNSNYKSSILNCAGTFNRIAEKDAYFTDNHINNNLVKIISYECPSKSYEKATISKAVDLALDCYYKTNKGKNIFVSSAIGETMCLYCGDIKFSNRIDNFNIKFINELKKRKNIDFRGETTSLNNYFLLDKDFLPKEVDKNEKLIYVYYTRYLKASKINNKNDLFENKDSNKKIKYNSGFEVLSEKINNLAYKINNYVSDVDYNLIVSGVSISKLKIVDDEDINYNDKKSLSFGNLKKNLIVNCGDNLIIPKKNFN